MIAIFDGDCLVYQVGFAADAVAKYRAQEKGEEEVFPLSWDEVSEMLDQRIKFCMEEVEATEAVFYLGSHTNFRHDISQTGYKLRTGTKPWHYANLKAVLIGRYGAISEEGLEADDLCAIKATEDLDNSCIISIDKDLRQVPCWHYSWEYGRVASFGPHKFSGYGELTYTGKKLLGGGMKFFLAQCITGDRVDSIVGIPGKGPAAALNILGDTQTYQEGLEAVRGAYKDFYGDLGDEKLLENGQLLYMIRERDEKGNPIMWRIDED